MFGWPSNSGHSKSIPSLGCGGINGAASVGVRATGAVGGLGGGGSGAGVGGVIDGGGRSHRARSNSFVVAHHELQAQPDRPMSLFEGLAGAAVYLADMVAESGVGGNPWFPSLVL